MGTDQTDRRDRASTVLVVDEESGRRDELDRLLARAGFHVIQAADADQARDQLARGESGVVIVDAHLPDVSGYDLCAEIQKAHGSDVYVLLRTTQQELAARALALDDGADDFLLEPLADAEILARVETGRKMTQLQERLEETHRSLALLDVTDPLTGAHNRRQTDAEIAREIERSRRYARPVSLVLVDLDGFRSLNDTLGRAAGDRVLVEIARLLRRSTRSADTVGRYGGEEFALLLPETSQAQALGAAEKVRKTIEQTPITVAGRTVHVTVSAGVATCERDNVTTAEDFTAAATRALVRAKNAGRNRCEAE